MYYDDYMIANYLLKSPKRDYFIFLLLITGVFVDVLCAQYWWVLLTAVSFGAYPTMLRAFSSLLEWKLTIEIFNALAIILIFTIGDIYSAAFVVLMLAFARILEWRTKTKTKDIVSELLKKKPQKAFRENGHVIDEILVERVRKDDILIVHPGEIVPVDGVVVLGKTEIDESLITGESLLSEKSINNEVLAATVNITKPIKIRATRIGEETTIKRIAELITQARKNKSKIQKFADVFEVYFLPVVLVLGLGIYLVTQNIAMTAALFLVACAKDISVAIPLAFTTTFGYAASKGIIIKNGQALSQIGRAKYVVLNKTGLLTYGEFIVKKVFIDESISKDDFWQAIAVAEKYSEHPIGKALFRESVKHILMPPNAQKYQVYKGAGVYARYGRDDIVLGNISVMKEHGVSLPRGLGKKLEQKYHKDAQSIVYVSVNCIFVGYIVILDSPSKDMKESLEKLRVLGIKEIIMLTEGRESSAAYMAQEVGIDKYYFQLKPEDKLEHIERLSRKGIVIMVGDGISDASALTQADIGIAMGRGGNAIAAETSDVVMLNDNILQLSEIIKLGRLSNRVIYGDMCIWFISNTIGFSLVLLGFIGPALAALYNFTTNFLPVLNSTQLFKKGGFKDVL